MFWIVSLTSFNSSMHSKKYDQQNQVGQGQILTVDTCIVLLLVSPGEDPCAD